MTVIIRQLLDFGRKDGGERMRVNLNTLATATAKMLETVAAKAGCTLVTELTSSPIDVEVNPREIEQVLTNLVMNAVQAMPRGGKVELRTTLEPGGSGLTSACISVSDQGVGIAEADLARVFDSIPSSRRRRSASAPASASRSATAS
jgi:signal transduction histidine kinase